MVIVMPRRAFTLLEIMIASSLVAVLMGLSWSMFSIYSRVEQRGSDAAIELQLARSLARQFQSDLRNVVRAPHEELPDDSSASDTISLVQAGFGLPTGSWVIGDATSLEMVVREAASLARSSSVGADPEHWHPAAPYQIVQYRWTSPPWRLEADAARTSRGEPTELPPDNPLVALPADRLQDERLRDAASNIDGLLWRLPDWGLIRRSRPWYETAKEAESELERMTDNDNDVEQDERVDMINSSARQEDRVREMTRLQFRYFDGKQWLLAWNSLSLQRLPVAIEMAFDIDPSAADPETQEQLEQRIAESHRNRLLDEGESINPFDEEGLLPSVDDRFRSDPTAIWTDYRIVMTLEVGPSDRSEEDVDGPHNVSEAADLLSRIQ